jgi:hypothetical protein
MFKRLWLVIVVVFSVGIFASTSAQVQPEKLSTLVDAAQFFPMGTPFYFAIRTDADYISTLNTIFVAVQERTVGTALSILERLDMLFEDIFSTDFQTTVAPFLGDYIAFGILPLDNVIDYDWNNDRTEYGVLIQITNRDAATEFVRTFFVEYLPSPITTETSDSFTAFYAGNYDPTRFIITDNHLVITNADTLTPPMPVRGNLAQTSAFVDTLNNMPADAYNFVAFLDVPVLQSYINALNRIYGYNYRPLNNLLVLQTMGAIAVAGKIENGNALILDAVLSIGNTIGMELLGLPVPPDLPVNPEFANIIPSDAIFAVHGVSPFAYGDYFRDSAIAVWRYLSASEFNPEYDAQIEMWVNQSYVALGRIADAIFANMTGLSLQRDFANWLSRDGVFFIRSNPELDNPLFLIDMAFVSQVTDGEQSLASIRRLMRALPITLRTLGLRSVTYTETKIAGADALMLSFHNYSVSDNPALELVITANENVFVIGTPRAVEDVLTGRTGGAFLQSPASAYILPDANIVLYDNFMSALPLARWAVMQDRNNLNRQVIEAIVNVLGEGVISLTTVENGITVMRAVQILNIGR